jgi:hypothetical protein
MEETVGEVTAAALIGVTWVILCVCCAMGLFLGERLLIMARLHCDWADAGSRQRMLARKHYAKHRRPEVKSRQVLAVVPAGVIERADRVLETDHTRVITPVTDETVITGVAVDSPTQTFVRGDGN